MGALLPPPAGDTTPPVLPRRTTEPVLAAHIIDRPRLFAEASLDELSLAVLVAPSGYGKTTAAYQLASAMDADICWLTIEPNTTEAEQVIAGFAAALGLGLQTDPQKLRHSLEQFWFDSNDLIRPTVLILDDFHEISDPSLAQRVGEWLATPAPNLTVVCAGRSEPGFPLEKLRTTGRLLELRRADLAFRTDEAEEVFSASFGPTAPDPAALDEILRCTEGWPALTYLAGLKTQTNEPPGSLVPDVSPCEPVERYLWSEALADLPDADLAFMTTTSMAEVLEPDLVDVLAETTTGMARLQRLARNEQFTEAIDHPARRFRYHPLVRQVLLDRLESQDVDRFRALNRKAARWYLHNGQIVHALQCAISNNNTELGQQLIIHGWRTTYRDGSFEAIEQWADTVGPDGTAHGAVCLILAWAALTSGDEERVDKWLTRARSFAPAEIADDVELASNQIRASLANRQGNIQAMNQFIAAAREIAGPLEPERYEQPAMQALHGAVFSNVGVGAFLAGDIDTASPILVETVDFCRHPHRDYALSKALNYLAMVDALSGREANALEHIDEILDRYARGNAEGLPLPVMAYLARSKILLDRSDIDGADEAFERTQELLDEMDEHPIERGLVELHHARLLHHRGALSLAREAIASARARAREAGPSILDSQIRSTENALRFLGQGSNDQLPPGARELTERELEIVHLLPTALSRSEIADRLHISENTIKTHLTSISRKLNARGRAAIVDRSTELRIVGSRAQD